MNVNNMLINTRLNPRHALAIGVALLVLLCLSLAYTLKQWQADWRLTRPDAIAVLPVTIKADDTMAGIRAIPQAHLFGKSISNDVPITNLQLHVTGIVKVDGEQSSYSKAYISISGQPSKIYQAGDSLAYGVKIYEITPTAVILENRDKHLEKLPLPREPLQFRSRHAEESTPR